jgi:hypothetical protein
VLEANSLLHGQETDAFGDAGYQGMDKRPDVSQTVRWHVAMKRSKRQALDENTAKDALIEQIETIIRGATVPCGAAAHDLSPAQRCSLPGTNIETMVSS